MTSADPGDLEFEAWLEQEKRHLRTSDEDGWIATATFVEWEDGGWVLDWMLDQPQCTKQIAAAIFWATDPFFGLEREAGGQKHFNPNVSVEDMVMQKVLRLWRTGKFKTGDAHYVGKGDRYRSILARYPSIPDPLDVPLDLLDGFPSQNTEALARANARRATTDSESVPELSITGNLIALVFAIGCFALAALLMDWL